MKELELEQEKVGKLIAKYGIPSVISMLVASLYNIVDQIYIGQSTAGAYGNAATNIVYPFTVIALACALLIGVGMATLFNLSCGARDVKRANKCIGNGFSMLLIIALLLTAVGILFGNQILTLFGATPEEAQCYAYATDYYWIICCGLPFYIIGQGLINTINGDGSPRYGMACILVGAFANIILDPIFIYSLNLSVKGAAIATVIGQFLTFAMAIFYVLFKSKKFKITKDNMKLDLGVCKSILGLGAASFFTQLTIVIVIAVQNNLVGKYGYETLATTGEPYGIVTPLAVIGICMKVFGIVISLIIGIALGSAPVIAFNMGAGNVSRVKEAIKDVLIINGIVGCIAFIIFQFFPTYIVNIFGTANSQEYMEYAIYCFRIFLCAIICTALFKSISNILQAMGAGLSSMILSIVREVCFCVPASVIIAAITHNIVYMLWAAPIADVLSLIIAIILLKRQLAKLNQMVKPSNDKSGDKS